MIKTKLPYNWKPRPYQWNLWKYLTDGGKRAVACWHRRAGKDELCLHYTAVAAFSRQGNYWHMLPEYSQARKAIWDALNPHTGKRRIDEAFPPEIRSFTREHEMMIGLVNGATWQVVGSDNYNSLMGTSPAGIVQSEFALSNPSAWGYFAPILEENKGWAAFISTPRGHNHFENLYKLAKKEAGWFSELLTNNETHVFAEVQMQSELRRMQALYGDEYGESLWKQEYFCSFDAALPGSIWGDCLDKAQKEGRIGSFDLDAKNPVSTAWDLGRTDSTAIWFFQILPKEIRIIDYHESNLKDIEFYANLLREKKYTYGTHWLPHDARARTLAAGGKSIQQQMLDARVGRIVIAPRLDHVDGIQAARATFPYCRFNKDTTSEGIEVLRNYRYEWDEDKQMFSAMPVHDWASHGSSAFRTLSLSWKRPKAVQPDSPLIDKLQAQSINNMSFGKLRDKLFRRKKQEREMRIL